MMTTSRMTTSRSTARARTDGGAPPEMKKGLERGPFSSTLGTRGSGRGVLQLLQRTHLDLGRGRLGGEPLLFLGERVDALALRLRRHVDGRDLQQARQGEG